MKKYLLYRNGQFVKEVDSKDLENILCLEPEQVEEALVFVEKLGKFVYGSYLIMENEEDDPTVTHSNAQSDIEFLHEADEEVDRSEEEEYDRAHAKS